MPSIEQLALLPQQFSDSFEIGRITPTTANITAYLTLGDLHHGRLVQVNRYYGSDKPGFILQDANQRWRREDIGGIPIHG